MRISRRGRPGAKLATKLRGSVAAGLLPTLVLAGCAFLRPQPPIEDSRLVAASPRVALDRAHRWLRSHGFSIDKDFRQRSGGRVVASRSPFDRSGYARCAWAFSMSGGAKPAADVAVLATPERRGWTRVRAVVDISLVNQFGDRAQCASQGKLEREILSAVASGG